MKQIIYFQIGVERYPLEIEDTKDEEVVYIRCEEADLDQRYARIDLPLLFKDLPDMIRDFQSEKEENALFLKLSWSERVIINDLASQNGYNDVIDYIKDRILINNEKNG